MRRYEKGAGIGRDPFLVGVMDGKGVKDRSGSGMVTEQKWVGVRHRYG